MKTLFAAAALAAGVLAAGPAQAKDLTGRFGVGYDRSIGTVDGISMRYQVAPNFGLQGILGFESVSGPGDSSESTIELGLRGVLGIASTPETNLGIVFGLDVLNQGQDVGGMDVSSTDFALEAGMHAEYFFNDMLSVHGELGLVIFLGDDATSTIIGASPIDLGVGAAPDLLGSLGFTFWFE